MEAMPVPVSKKLYGLSIEEINHAIEGGIYAELIQNRSFEDGVLPLHCSYNANLKALVTPNGWTLPFPHADSIPGWRRFAGNTYIATDNKRTINDKNQRSLMVSVYASEATGRGGIIAEGYKGIPVRKDEKYNLSFYMRTSSTVIPRTINVALEDSAGLNMISNVYKVKPSFEWERFSHTFTAREDAENAILTFTSDSSTFFWLDVVSLFPEKTWNDRKNGLKPGLMEMVAALNPSFIRFPGGAFVEGYATGTYPVWKESLGNIAERKHFWNVWSYGSSNGMGFHEFLEMCEDLKAEPVYVINSGITSQTRKPRYEDITQMTALAEDALGAIAYANDPPNTPYGEMRSRNGHPEPFDLKYIEMGSDNYGYEYERRFEYFRKLISTTYPDVTVISSSVLNKQAQSNWADHHFHSNPDFFITNHSRFNSREYLRHYPGIFIGEFSTIDKRQQGTLGAAVAEACFLIGVESNPDKVKRLAYSNIFSNANYNNECYPLILFNNSQMVASPSYYLMQIFNKYRGDNIVKTEVNTYHKPQVSFGKAGIEFADNNYEIKNLKLNNKPVDNDFELKGNNIFFGDSSMYNYEFSADIRQIKSTGQIKFLMRSNGEGDTHDYIGMALANGFCELYNQSGSIRDTLTSPIPFQVKNEEWYNVRMACTNDTIRCYINNSLIYEVILPALPSLVTLATYDEANNMILLKVVNTTQHEEKTELHIQGRGVKNHAQLIQLTGLPHLKNTFDNPMNVVPEEKSISFPLGGMIYSFPPNSVTVMQILTD